jgi:hypothetical protein
MDINISIHWLTFTDIYLLYNILCQPWFLQKNDMFAWLYWAWNFSFVGFRTNFVTLYILIYFSKLYHTLNQLDQCIVISNVTTLILRECEGEDFHSRNGSLGVNRDSRTFRERFQGSKHLALDNYLYLWKDIEMKMFKMGLHDPFRHLQHKLGQKERLGVKLAVWLPTTKSQESMRPLCVQVDCNTPLESSRRELQLCIRPHPDWRYERGVIVPQNYESPNLGSFGTPPWESWDKKSFRCRHHGEVQRILHGGRWWLPPSPGRGGSFEFEVACGLS